MLIGQLCIFFGEKHVSKFFATFEFLLHMVDVPSIGYVTADTGSVSYLFAQLVVSPNAQKGLGLTCV